MFENLEQKIKQKVNQAVGIIEKKLGYVNLPGGYSKQQIEQMKQRQISQQKNAEKPHVSVSPVPRMYLVETTTSPKRSVTKVVGMTGFDFGRTVDEVVHTPPEGKVFDTHGKKQVTTTHVVVQPVNIVDVPRSLQEKAIGKRIYRKMDTKDKIAANIATLLSEQGREYIGSLLPGGEKPQDVVAKRIGEAYFEKPGLKNEVKAGVEHFLRSPVFEIETAGLMGVGAASSIGQELLSTTAGRAAATALGASYVLGSGAKAIREYELGNKEKAIGTLATTGLSIGAAGLGFKAASEFTAPRVEYSLGTVKTTIDGDRFAQEGIVNEKIISKDLLGRTKSKVEGVHVSSFGTVGDTTFRGQIFVDRAKEPTRIFKIRGGLNEFFSTEKDTVDVPLFRMKEGMRGVSYSFKASEISENSPEGILRGGVVGEKYMKFEFKTPKPFTLEYAFANDEDFNIFKSGKMSKGNVVELSKTVSTHENDKLMAWRLTKFVGESELKNMNTNDFDFSMKEKINMNSLQVVRKSKPLILDSVENSAETTKAGQSGKVSTLLEKRSDLGTAENKVKLSSKIVEKETIKVVERTAPVEITAPKVGIAVGVGVASAVRSIQRERLKIGERAKLREREKLNIREIPSVKEIQITKVKPKVSTIPKMRFNIGLKLKQRTFTSIGEKEVIFSTRSPSISAVPKLSALQKFRTEKITIKSPHTRRKRVGFKLFAKKGKKIQKVTDVFGTKKLALEYAKLKGLKVIEIEPVRAKPTRWKL